MQTTASQFSLRSVLITMVTASMVLAYVRSFGEEGTILLLSAFVSAILWGGVLGWAAGRLTETLTWSAVAGALALCCVLSADSHVTLFQKCYWIALGTIGGAAAGCVKLGDWKLRGLYVLLLWSTFAIIGLVGAIGPILFFDQWNAALDSILALPVLIGLMALVELVGRHRQRHRIALDVWAAGIVFAVIAGNFGAAVVWNLWYA